MDKTTKLKKQIKELKKESAYAWSLFKMQRAKYDDLKVKLYQYDRLRKDIFNG